MCTRVQTLQSTALRRAAPPTPPLVRPASPGRAHAPHALACSGDEGADAWAVASRRPARARRHAGLGRLALAAAQAGARRLSSGAWAATAMSGRAVSACAMPTAL